MARTRLTRSKGSPRARASALSPSPTDSTSKPSVRSAYSSGPTMSGSSSATRMRALIGQPLAYERVEGVWGNREVPPQHRRRGLVGETWFPPRERAEGERRSCEHRPLAGRAQLLPDAGALHEPPRAGLRDELVVLDDHLTAHEHHLLRAALLRALEEAVVHARVVRLRGHGQLLLGIPDDDVGVAPHRDRPLPRVEPEPLRDVRRGQLDEPVQRDAAAADAEVVQHVKAVLDARASVRDLLELAPVDRLLVRPVERAVVGGDDGEVVRDERLPQVLLLLLRAGRRRVDVLPALPVGLLQRGLVDEEVLRARLTPDVPALLPRESDRLDRG